MSTWLVGSEVVIQQGRTSRVEELYELHAPKIGRLAYLLTGDPDLAQDLAHEAFVRLIGRLRFIRDEKAIAFYLRRSVVNLARNHWRRIGRERSFIRREGDGLLGRATDLPDVAARDEIWQSLMNLTHRQRAAIVLRFYEDLSERQTARVLGCALGTVKSSVARGLRQMRREMSSDEGIRT